jgi:RecB family exonuclease
LSGSSLDGLDGCALKWYLAHEVRAEPAKGGAVGFGSVLHALADDAVRRDPPLADDALAARIDQVWNVLDFEARWQSDRERDQARAALTRFLTWHRSDRGRTLIGSEVPFSIGLTVEGREVLLRGSMDRVELDRDGRVVVVDLKTMKNPVSGPALAEHVQLGVYQLAVREGALDERLEAPGAPGGAELVQLRIDDKGGPKVQRQAALEPVGDPAATDATVAGAGPVPATWIDGVLSSAVDRLVREDFAPDPSAGSCTFCPFTASCPAMDDGMQVL